MTRPARPGRRRAVSALGAVAAVVLLGLGLAACGSDPLPAGSGAAARASVPRQAGCTWPMAGGSLLRLHQTGCAAPGAVSAANVERLVPVWSVAARAEVTGAPAITADALYFGDWSGRAYAVDRGTGRIRWTRDLRPIQPIIYAGQAPASPTITRIDGREAMVIASGRSVWALRTSDGRPLWTRVLGHPDDPKDPTEIQGSPAVADGLVVVPTDLHNDGPHRSGLVALRLADGTPRWRFDPEAGRAAAGCGSIWGTPSVDVAAGLVVVGTGSCFHREGWSRYAEAIVGVDLRTGRPRWSYQPRTKLTAQDWDFAGAPNLFSIDGRPVAGLGSKDGEYYVVDRRTGKLVWRSRAVKRSSTGDGFAFGGFIGATSVAPDRTGRLVVAGGTAVGDCPCQHGFDAATGRPRWQSPASGGTYGASAAAGGLVFTAGTDQTLRAYDLATGKVRWEHALSSLSASGPAIAGDLVAIGVGFREPGSGGTPSGGVQAFRVLRPGERPPATTTTTRPTGPAVTALQPSDQACVGAPCDLDFTLKDPPAGHHPTLTLEVTPSPLSITVRGHDLGDPASWLGAAGPASKAGASVFAVFVTPRDDQPQLGSIVCVLGEDDSCTGDAIALRAGTYTRISILALADATTPPTLQEGYDRLVTTHSFDPGLVPAS